MEPEGHRKSKAWVTTRPTGYWLIVCVSYLSIYGLSKISQNHILQFRHGATMHGPKPRSHAIKLQKKVRRLGLKSTLSARTAEGKVISSLLVSLGFSYFPLWFCPFNLMDCHCRSCLIVLHIICCLLRQNLDSYRHSMFENYIFTGLICIKSFDVN